MAPEITDDVAKLKLKPLSVTGWRAYIFVQLQYIRHSKYTVVDILSEGNAKDHVGRYSTSE